MRRAGASSVSVELRDVWFRYAPDLPWVLTEHSVRVEPGEQLTLRARSGSGKSTLLRLVAGLLAPERGVIRIGDRSPEEARDWVAYLPQDTYLFEGTVMDNLQLLSGASLRTILDMARATGLDRWLESLPMAYETLLPPGGTSLSGGQRQWIRITAALASERPVLLLDESLSQLDPLTRRKVLDGASLANKTVLWVTHDEPREGQP